MSRVSINGSLIDDLNRLNSFVFENCDTKSKVFSLTMIRELLPKFLNCMELANDLAVELVKTESALDTALNTIQSLEEHCIFSE